MEDEGRGPAVRTDGFVNMRRRKRGGGGDRDLDVGAGSGDANYGDSVGVDVEGFGGVRRSHRWSVLIEHFGRRYGREAPGSLSRILREGGQCLDTLWWKSPWLLK
jgi:hypothetical protein